jgi:hypothetical protein
VPADNATNTAVGDNVVLTFSEAVLAGTGSITIVNAADATDTRTIAVTDAGQVTVSGTTVTINPTADLKAGVAYYVNMPATAFVDAAGNAYAGITGTTALNFTVTAAAVAVTGTTYTLTTGLDSVPGTASDDLILADNAIMQASDVIVGGLGTDTLSYTDGSTTGVSMPVANVSGVEVYNIRNVNTAAGVNESSTVTWSAVAAAGGTQTIGGMTITTAAIVGGETAANIAIVAAGGVVAGTTITTAPTAWTVGAAAGNGNVFTSTTLAQNVADLAATGTFTGATAAGPTSVVAAQGRSGAINTVVATSFAGATDFNSTTSTGNVNFTALAAGQKVGISGNAAVINGDVGVGYGATVTAGVINVSGGTTRGTITETGAGITSNTINSTGAANTLTNVVLSGGSNVALTVNAATNLTTGNITGFSAAGTTATITVAGAAASVNLGTIEAATVKTITATGMTAGGVTATLNANTVFNFSGGAGNDVITLGGVALVTGAMVDAGAGTADRLIVTVDAEVTTATAPFIKNFEVVQANTGVTVDVSQLSAFNTITGVRVNDSVNGGAVTINGITATQAANVAIIAASNAVGAITLGLTGATTGGQIDTVNATLTTTSSQVSNLTGMSLVGVEKLTLTGSNTVAATTGAVTFETTAATSLDSIVLTNAGINTITIAAGQTATNLNVDASASIGNTTIAAGLYATATGATLKGGSGNDIIIGSANGDSINGGAGNDVLTGTAVTLANITAGTALAVGSVAVAVPAAVAADTFTGGAGLDVFAVGVGAIGTMSTITDLNLGTAIVGGGVDRIVTDSTNGTAVSVVVFSAAQQTVITNSATFAAALDAAIAAFGAVANVASTFTYGADTYFVLNDIAATTTFTATDLVIKITGVAGTLDASDITTL